jgi:hypothetical protein
MAFLHNNSCECVKSELDLFSVPPTQTSIESSCVAKYCPISSISHGLPLEFFISGSGQEYIDIANTQLAVKAKITRANGDNIDGTDHVSAVNLTLHSLFSELDFKVNDTLISSSNNMYAYRAYLETLLSFGQDAKNSQLTGALYYKDSSGHMESADPTAEENDGLRKRYALFRDGATVDMLGKLHTDVCFQERFLPSDVGLRIRLVRQKDAFCLMSDAAQPQYKLQIVDAKIYVRKVKLSSSVFVAHAKAVEQSNMKYPLHRVICKSFTIPRGNLDFSHENLFSGHLPTRIVLGLVENSAYNGSFDRNPFNFKHFDLAQLKIFVDGQQMNLRPLDLDFEHHNYVQGYMSLYEGTGKFGRDEGLDITRYDFANGYALYAFDLTPDLAENDHIQLQREGTIRLDLRFRSQLAQTINCVVYAESETILELDRNRQVIADYSN